MPIYTATADSNGDFTVPFSANYTSGQKIIVTAEKDGATKSIELYAPSEVTGGGVIKFSGTYSNFPQNIGVVTLTSQISGIIQANAMKSGSSADNIFYCATGLIIEGAVTEIKDYGFDGWYKAYQLTLPSGLIKIGPYSFQRFGSAATVDFGITLPNTVTTLSNYSFYYANMKSFDIGTGVTTIPQWCFAYTAKLETFNYRNVTTIADNAFSSTNLKYNLIPNTVTLLQSGCFQFAKSIEVSVGSGITTIPTFAFYQNTSCLKFTIGMNVSSIGANGMSYMTACNELICLPAVPPTITSTSLTSLKATCVIKVPVGSLSAYQTATNWSAFASQMVGV